MKIAIVLGVFLAAVIYLGQFVQSKFDGTSSTFKRAVEQYDDSFQLLNKKTDDLSARLDALTKRVDSLEARPERVIEDHVDQLPLPLPEPKPAPKLVKPKAKPPRGLYLKATGTDD